MKRTLTLLICLISFNVFAQKNIFNVQESDNNNLFEYAKYVNVGKTNYNIKAILNNNTLQYKQLESANHSVGFTSDNYWVNFKLKNNKNQPKTFYLETARPITDVVNLYKINENNIELFKNGDNVPFSQKHVKHHATVFKLILPPNKIQNIYIHLKSDGETINLPLNLYSETEFLLANYKQQLFFGLFYGVLFLAGIIYLFFYTSLKEKSFLYYGIYVFSIGLMQAALDGFIHEYILINGGYINNRTVLITALSSNLFLLKYCEHFLNVNTKLKAFKKAFNIIYGIIAFSFLMLFINAETLKIAYPLSNINGLISLLLILATIITMQFKRIKIDAFFSIGILFLVIGLLGFVMNNLSLLPNNFITLNSAKFGSGFEVIFLSLSMTNLIKKLRLEKEKSQEEALKKSEEISQLKTYFMSNMSHELRTPINAIMGIAESELETQQDNNNRKPFEIIKNASLSLLSNVNDIIDFEKIETNKLQLNSASFNPTIKLNQISNNWKTEAIKKGLNYTFEMDSEIPSSVYADADRFIQIINNVLSNAVKFTNKGAIYFKVKCLKQPNDMCRFSFQITDTGIGIDPSEKDRVFDSFNQMKLNHKRAFGGIGLGLTIAKHIIELFEGSLKIDSIPNKGTSVFIDLNLKSFHQIETPTANNVSENNPVHILVVEDNKMNQMVMRKILNGFPNTSFAIVNNGQEALDALKQNVYDLVLMDLQMPIMDGYEATEIIRNGVNGIKNNIPIIAVTADAMQETKTKVLNLGMNDYLTKPVNKALLLEKINQHKHINSETDNNDPDLKIA
ncbi:response regulator [Seonamhaeicola algicola]|uniref:histidine kinase n=1 Tax=Seonamhaeicola algicola TaxID=1719036 RepID=A0A5C7AXE5_9FLAO|nr:hybrid sensor histidine kinase/response regulator [Seonamhaeicola algicola]TXE12774.1 response regulator [Seonamhaeicola algicola]